MKDNRLRLPRGRAERVAKSLRTLRRPSKYRYPEAVAHPEGWKEATIEAAPGRFVIVEPELTAAQRIANKMLEKAIEGDVEAARWLEDKNVVSFDDLAQM